MMIHTFSLEWKISSGFFYQGTTTTMLKIITIVGS